MAKIRRKPSKRKAKVKFTQRMQLVAKSDKTRVHTEKGDTAGLKRIEGRPPADVGATFKIKIRKKHE